MDGDIEINYAKGPECSEPGMSSDHYMYEDIPQDGLNKNTTEYRFLNPANVGRDSPLDLRVTRLPSLIEFPKPDKHLKKKKKEVISIAELLESFHYDETSINYNSSSKLLLGNNYSLTGFGSNDFEQSNQSSLAIDYSAHPQKYFPTKYECSDSACTTWEKWNKEINSETTLPVLVDNHTQTQMKETKDTSVQTDLEPKIMQYSMIRNMQKTNAKFTCSICHRLYASKSNYERHLKTHVMFTNEKKIVSSVLFTTEAKLELSKKQVARKHQSETVIIQMPNTNNLQCDSCKEVFATQKEKDDHFEDCIVEPFFMTKCPECSIKFYTFECLNRHIGLVHNKLSASNAYYCIFCNENFDSTFTFQLHLDKHLSP